MCRIFLMDMSGLIMHLNTFDTSYFEAYDPGLRSGFILADCLACRA